MGKRLALSGTRITSGLALLAVLGLSACEKDVITAPRASLPTFKGPQMVFTITSGLTAYTDRAAWEAAIVTAGSSAQFFVFAGQTLGRVTALDTNYGTFHLTVDRLAASSFSNPGIAIIPDASCSLGIGDCNEFILNVQDPVTLIGDAPRVNTIVFPGNIMAFGGYFGQLGYTAGGTPSVTGPVTLHFGTESVIVNDYMGTNGYGFFGVVSTVPSTNVSITFAKTGSLINDLVELYNPAFANQPAPVGPGTVDEQLAALRAFLDGLDFLKGNPNGLDAKLSGIEKALGQDKKNSMTKACKALDQFIKKVNDKTDKAISAADAATLLDMAQTLSQTIGCSGGGPPV